MIAMKTQSNGNGHARTVEDDQAQIKADALAETDDIDQILAALRDLAAGCDRPVVRVCLEDAAADIAYLMGRTEEEPEVA